MQNTNHDSLSRSLTILALLVALGSPLLQAQQYKPGEYPSLRYPSVPKKPTIEDLMPTARSIVKRGDIGAMFYPGYAIKPSESGDPAVAKYFQENPDTPTGHFHVHNYFLTMVLTNADGSETIFVDKGHLTALDDPRVRQEAAKYGDPDELLRENWIPAIPGINVPGDYRKDYAGDPAAYVRKNLANWPYFR